jgi:hypothetical protein
MVAGITGLTAGWILGTASPPPSDPQNLHPANQPPAQVAQPNGFKTSRREVHPSSRPSTGDPNPIEPQFSKWGVTPEDIARNDEIEKLRREGHYFLPSERPIEEKATRYFHQEMVLKSGEETRKAATSELQKAGVPADKIEKLVEHLDKTRLASLQLARATIGFDESRTLLKEALRTQLAPEALEKLNVSLLNEGGRLDLNQFRGDLEKASGTPLSSEQEDRLLNVLRVTGAYTSPPRDGLYDPPPKVAAGTDRVLNLNREMLAATEEGYRRLRDALSDPVYSAEERTVLQTYFERKIAYRKGEIQKLENYKPEDDLHD